MMSIEEAIVEKLRESSPCCLDNVVTSLANFSWGEVFSAVVGMSRDGWMLLRQSSDSAYQLSLGSWFARTMYSNSTSRQSEQTAGHLRPTPQVSTLCVKRQRTR